MIAPNRHKMALVTWAIVYPMITFLIAVLEPVLGAVPMPLRTLVLSALMVPAMVYVVLPFATARLNGWLTRTPSR